MNDDLLEANSSRDVDTWTCFPCSLYSFHPRALGEAECWEHQPVSRHKNHRLLKLNIAPEQGPSQKGKYSSNHHFSGAMLIFGGIRRYTLPKTNNSPLKIKRCKMNCPLGEWPIFQGQTLSVREGALGKKTMDCRNKLMF